MRLTMLLLLLLLGDATVPIRRLCCHRRLKSIFKRIRFCPHRIEQKARARRLGLSWDLKSIFTCIYSHTRARSMRTLGGVGVLCVIEPQGKNVSFFYSSLFTFCFSVLQLNGNSVKSSPSASPITASNRESSTIKCDAHRVLKSFRRNQREDTSSRV